MLRELENKERKNSWPRGRLRTYVEGREQYYLAILLLVVGCMAGIVLYHIDGRSFLYFGDGVSHIVRARQFFDSQRPGLNNIGTVWLPIPHLILVPLVAIDALFYSGIAGALVGIPCLVGACVLVFLAVRRITGSPAIAFLSGCLLGFNPNLVYMALTPMNELILIFLVTLSGYAFLRWHLNDGEHWLWACGAAIVLASLCRYEAWFLVPLVSLVSGLKGIWLWRRSERRIAFRFLLVAGLCWAGVVFWVCWNDIEYGDPLKFARWTYSVAPGATGGNAPQGIPDELLVLGRALLVIFGPVVLVTASGAFARLQSAPSIKTDPKLLLLFFGLPVVFAFAAVLAGFVQVDRWGWNWRYVLTAGPLLALAAGIGFSEFCRTVRSTPGRGLAVAGLLVMPLVQIAVPSVGVATFDDARRSISDSTRFAAILGEQLHGIHAEGSIALLTGYGQAQRIMISSGLPLKQFHIIYDPAEEDILGSLPDSDRYLVIGKDRRPESEHLVNTWLSRRDELLHYYTIRLENGHYVLMERKGQGRQRVETQTDPQ